MKAPAGARANHTNSGGHKGNMDRVNRGTDHLGLDVATGPDLKGPRPSAPKELMSVHQNRGGHIGNRDNVDRSGHPDIHSLDTDIMDQN